jgi:hypothetical protein
MSPSSQLQERTKCLLQDRTKYTLVARYRVKKTALVLQDWKNIYWVPDLKNRKHAHSKSHTYTHHPNFRCKKGQNACVAKYDKILVLHQHTHTEKTKMPDCVYFSWVEWRSVAQLDKNILASNAIQASYKINQVFQNPFNIIEYVCSSWCINCCWSQSLWQEWYFLR